MILYNSLNNITFFSFACYFLLLLKITLFCLVLYCMSLKHRIFSSSYIKSLLNVTFCLYIFLNTFFSSSTITYLILSFKVNQEKHWIRKPMIKSDFAVYTCIKSTKYLMLNSKTSNVVVFISLFYGLPISHKYSCTIFL